MTDIEASDEALNAFQALTPAERGLIVEQWYAQHQPRSRTRYKRERYSLQLLQDLLDTTEKHVQEYGFYRRVSSVDYTGSSLMGRLNTIEGSLTNPQVAHPAYLPLKTRLDALRRKYQLEHELLKSRRINR